MPNCSICGQPIDKLPHWLDEVEITFRCAACAESTAHHPVEIPDDDDTKESAVVPEVDDEEVEDEEEDEAEE